MLEARVGAQREDSKRPCMSFLARFVPSAGENAPQVRAEARREAHGGNTKDAMVAEPSA